MQRWSRTRVCDLLCSPASAALAITGWCAWMRRLIDLIGGREGGREGVSVLGEGGWGGRVCMLPMMYPLPTTQKLQLTALYVNVCELSTCARFCGLGVGVVAGWLGCLLVGLVVCWLAWLFVGWLGCWRGVFLAAHLIGCLCVSLGGSLGGPASSEQISHWILRRFVPGVHHACL